MDDDEKRRGEQETRVGMSDVCEPISHSPETVAVESLPVSFGRGYRTGTDSKLNTERSRLAQYTASSSVL